MFRQLLSATLLVGAFSTSFAQAVRVTAHGGATDVWGSYFDPQHKITFSGKITGIEKVKVTSDSRSEVTLLVRSPGNKATSVVDLGPSWFVDHQSAKVKVGDKVQVTGSKAIIDGRGIVVSSMIVLRGKGGPVLALRRPNGRAYWVGTETVQNATPPAGSNVVQGTISGFQSYTYNNEPYQSAVIQTPNGQTYVDLGPQWYYGQQNFAYQIGDGVQVVIGGNPIAVGPNMNIMSTYSIYGGSNVYTLRYGNGTPVYNWGQ